MTSGLFFDKEKNVTNIIGALNFRFACKTFDSSRKISDSDFQTILEAGRLSPSSFGFEPWKFLVAQRPELREALRSVSWGAQAQAPTASHFLILLARQPIAVLPTSEYLQKTIMEETQKLPTDLREARTEKYAAFLEDDFALAGNERACFEWACRQTYIALSNMMTAAATLGIDSCPIEGFHKEKLETLLAEKGFLDRKIFGVACMAAFGYRAEPPHRAKTRRPIEQIVQWIE